VRPCLLLTDYPQEDELVLFTIVAHTASVRGTRWEIEIDKPFLKDGVFQLQEIHTVNMTRLMRRLRALSAAEMKLIENGLRHRLGF
jgi:mRNA interferase MazF